MRAGLSEIGELVERCADSAPGVENVVDDHDVLAVDVPRECRLADDRSRSDRLEVIAVERDVERALRDLSLSRSPRSGHEMRRAS